MIKLIIFDLDGVLVDTRHLHFDSLNQALQSLGYDPITHDEHLAKYDGLPTKTKLTLLSKEKGVSINDHDKLWRNKQDFTQDLLKNHLQYDARLVHLLKSLKTKQSLLRKKWSLKFQNKKQLITK